MESMKDYEKELERSFRTINEGDIVSGAVVAVTDEEVTLDLNYYAPGIIKIENLSNDPDFHAKEELQPGDIIEATVVRTDDGHGNIELSKKEANEVLAWDKLREMMEQQTVVTVRIKESVPSGVVAFLEGIRAFIPASQLSADYVEDTDAWIGKDVRVVVITVDPEKNKLVLSGKVVARQEREEERNHRIAMLVPGSVVEGTVESIMPYGAFINIGNGISGLVHISQISQKRISSVHEVLKGYRKEDDIYIEVSDNGLGMPQDMVEQLLTDNNRVRKHGSGVGVINVHNRIRLRFGKPYGLEIESMPDEGTTIRIHLPYIPYEPEKLELLENGKMQELKGGKSNEEK